MKDALSECASFVLSVTGHLNLSEEPTTAFACQILVFWRPPKFHLLKWGGRGYKTPIFDRNIDQAELAIYPLLSKGNLN